MHSGKLQLLAVVGDLKDVLKLVTMRLTRDNSKVQEITEGLTTLIHQPTPVTTVIGVEEP